MDTTFRDRMSQVWFAIQDGLIPEIERQLGEATTAKQRQLIRILEVARVKDHLPDIRSVPGRPQRNRAALARAFVAKAVLNLANTEALIERLRQDRSLARLCGFDPFRRLPDAAMSVPGRVLPDARVPERFYGLRQGSFESIWVEFGLVGVHRLRCAGDALCQDDNSQLIDPFGTAYKCFL